MLIQVQTESGKVVKVPEAVMVFWVKICPYLDHEFRATNPRQRFCCHSHQQMFSAKNLESA